MAADLHVHSTVSDGCLSPCELVDLAKQKGLSAIALTDHDSTEGVAEAENRGRDMGLTVIPGVEISCEADDCEYHILGYGIDLADLPLLDRLARLRESRHRRLEQIVSRLAAHGINLDLQRVREIAGSGAVGRPHVAEALIERGYADSRAQAFQRHLNRGRPGYVPREKILPREAIDLIRAAGGVAVWAHPGWQLQSAALAELVGYGLWGIEVWHPDHSPQRVRSLLDLVVPQGLHLTGGSDFHCAGAGCGLGGCTATDAALAVLQEAVRRLSKPCL